MTDEQTQETISWDKINTYDYVKFDENTKTTIIISNWILMQKEELDFEDKSKRVIRKYIEADVSEYNGQKATMKLRSSSVNLLAKLKPILMPKAVSTKVKIEIVRTGSGKATKYVVTEVQ